MTLHNIYVWSCVTLGNTGLTDGQMEADCENFASGGSNTVKSNGNNNFFFKYFFGLIMALLTV